MYFKRHHSIPTDTVVTRVSMSKSPAEQLNSSPTGSRPVEQLYVLGLPLHRTSQSFQFLYAVAGVMLFFLLYGYVQVLTVCEYIILANSKFRSGYFALMGSSQCLAGT